VKKTIGILATLLIIIFWMYRYNFSDATVSGIQKTVSKPLNEQSQTQKTLQNLTPSNIPSVAQKPESGEHPQNSNALEKSSCTTPHQLDSDPRQQAAHQWMDDSFGVDVDTIANIYAYSSEADLLQAAENGDSTAMLALGMNYKWFAIHDNFQSQRLRPKDLPNVIYTVKPFDKNIMKKARHWLMQAALNNQLVGLTELAFSYADEKNHTEDSEEKQALEINFLGYFTLVDSMQPSVEKTISADLFYAYDKEKQKSLEKKKAELMTQWREDRRKLGQKESLELNPSKEVIGYLELQKNLCRDIKKEQS